MSSTATVPGASRSHTAREAAPHVAHILPWRNVGGTEIATLRLIRAAAGAGYRATAFHLPGAHPVRTLFEDAGVETAEFEEIVPSYRHGLRFLKQSRRLATQLRAAGATAIHCADVRSAFMTGLAGRFARVPVICHVRNRYRAFPARSRLLLRNVDHFVFVSRQTMKEFALAVPPARATVLYDGIRMPAGRTPASRAMGRAALGEADDRPLIGMVARVARQKDFETLIQAAAHVVAAVPEVRFVVVGDHESADYGSYYHELRRLLTELQIEQSFVFTGHRSDVAELLAAFDVFVLSTHWEGFPLVILEAMAHELPVVATAVDGIPEIVKHQDTGLLVPEGDVGALAEALLALLRDRAMAQRLAANARALVAHDFSEDAYTAAVTALYRRLLPGVASTDMRRLQ